MLGSGLFVPLVGRSVRFLVGGFSGSFYMKPFNFNDGMLTLLFLRLGSFRSLNSGVFSVPLSGGLITTLMVEGIENGF